MVDCHEGVVMRNTLQTLEKELMGYWPDCGQTPLQFLMGNLLPWFLLKWLWIGWEWWRDLRSQSMTCYIRATVIAWPLCNFVLKQIKLTENPLIPSTVALTSDLRFRGNRQFFVSLSDVFLNNGQLFLQI